MLNLLSNRVYQKMDKKLLWRDSRRLLYKG